MSLDLLPSSATQLERDLSNSSDSITRLSTAVEGIRTTKFQNIPENVVGWLIYEYGLGEILPYVPDTQRAVAEGIAWQRIRGTKAAVATALGWIDFAATIEESEAGTINWADFQLGLDAAPNGLEFTENVIQVSKLSSPIRSKLFRVYSDQYDYRRFWLDDTDLSSGSWLSDHTGVYLHQDKDWPQLSFGREHQGQSTLDFNVNGELGIVRTITDGGHYEDRTLLDIHKLGENPWKGLHIVDGSVTISRLISWTAGPWWYHFPVWNTSHEKWNNVGNVSWTQYLEDWLGTNDPKNKWESGIDWAGVANNIAIGRRTYSKAGLYLSDYSELGETNSCFNPRYREEFGFGAVQLSEGDITTGEGVLSEHVARFEFTEITERFERATQAEALNPLTTIGGALAARSGESKRRIPSLHSFVLSEGSGRLSEFIPSPPVIANAHRREHTRFITETFWPQSVDSEHKKVITIIYDYTGQAGIGARLHTRLLDFIWQRFITNDWVEDREVWAGSKNSHYWHGASSKWGPSTKWLNQNPWTSDVTNWDQGTWETIDQWNKESTVWGQVQWHTYSTNWNQDAWIDLASGDWQSGGWSDESAGTDWNEGDWVGELQAWNPSTLTIESKHQTTN